MRLGNAYITGQTKSTNFPTTAGAFDRSFNVLNCPRCGIDQYDAFVAKLNPSGSALVYSTFLGGTDIDDARGIAVDGSGNAYVTGETTSPDFPTTAGAFARTIHGAYDVFVTKLNASGSALVYSTYLGGTNVDNGERIAVDAGGQALVLGFSSSSDFPTTAGALDITANGGFDITLTKLNAAGTGLVYSTFLGGSDAEFAGGLAVDAAGNTYVSGTTASANFPTTPGVVDRTPAGGDAFVSKINPAGSALIYSTLLGGTASDGATAVQTGCGGQRLGDGHHELGRLSGHARRGADGLSRRRRRVRDRVECPGLGAPVFDLSRRHPVRRCGRCGARRGHRDLRRGTHVLAGFSGDGRRLRYGLQRRPVDLLGRCVHRQDFLQPDHLQPAGVAAGSGCAGAGRAGQRRVVHASR